ncbi:lysosomal acid glucosylceramidase [Nasonia vitripennis]|uniref:Glucosylceramidase n=1 Tax=Nasonia vitripennis TaxID=7425 RepID=A0A7M7TB32_NASVI|nr:lysosomal acid glucosylceramidase [Nasonia vitripennis]XP_031788437.1 lysosomal acid glucosylceramidase [Nasonia vitripennis]
MSKITWIIVALYCATVIAQDCKPVNFGSDSIVCECNSTYCDNYPDPKPPSEGEFIWYVTSKSGQRLNRTDGKIDSRPKNGLTVRIDSNKLYQNMEGFGGAFTDSACINIKSLSQETQDNLMNSYFSTNGSNYNFGRVPIGGSDFSTRPYSYDSTPGDKELKDFSLAKEDTEYKIPLMQKARKINPSLRFLSAAWTAPPWMKNRKIFVGFSYLLEEYYQTYADYIVKFLETYKSYGLDMWAVSAGNEPFNALLLIFSKINNMFWSPGNACKWVINNLGPSIEQSKSNNTIILMLDDNRVALPWYMVDVKIWHSEALKYVKGIAVHWYTDTVIPASVLDLTHDLLPDKFILMTEACVGDRPWVYPKVNLGSWQRAEEIVDKIFENINHHVVGWVDWNLALDLQGGPNWVDNYVDAPIIVDDEKDVFYKQPMYYVTTHFSKFVPRNSVRVHTNSEDKNVIATAFKTGDYKVIVLLFNKSNKKKSISIVDEKVGSINVELTENSVHTILYNYDA